MRSREPRPISHALEGLRARLAPRTTLAQVQAVWEEVVGAAIASEAAPVSERDGVLTVLCGSSVWASELTMMSSEVASSLSGRIGVEGAVRELRCRTR